MRKSQVPEPPDAARVEASVANATPKVKHTGDLSPGFGNAAPHNDTTLLVPSFVIVVPHASNRVPGWLPADALESRVESHQAYDRGAAEVGRALASRLNAQLILGNVSRLVVDLNRSPENGEAIPSQGEGVSLLAGDLANGDLASRLTLHERYHARVAAAISDFQFPRRPVNLIDLHSFTRTLDGAPRREVDVGVCFSGMTGFDSALLDALGVEARLMGTTIEQGDERRPIQIRRDEPYSGQHAGAFTGRHYAAFGAWTATLEICDDLISSKEAAHVVADLLARASRRAAGALSPRPLGG
jgi:predicted N-formylglutamate amidohydrolase